LEWPFRAKTRVKTSNFRLLAKNSVNEKKRTSKSRSLPHTIGHKLTKTLLAAEIVFTKQSDLIGEHGDT